MISSKVDPRNRLNDLNGKEWLQLSRSWWFQRGLGRGHPETALELQHPAPFSFRDVQKIIQLFTKRGMTVLDPFSGVGSTVKAAALIGRNATGIEVSRRWVTLGRARVTAEVGARARDGLRLRQIQGDCRKVLPVLKPRSIDLVVSSPPYWTILTKDPDHKTARRVRLGLATRYTRRSTADLGNIANYPKFLSSLRTVVRGCRRVMRPGAHAVFIVGDFRHGPKFYPYHADFIRLAEQAGLELTGVFLLIQSGKSLFPYGYPFTLVQNIHHQYALVFRRPRNRGSRPGDRLQRRSGARRA
jgi:DNA modification methylase